MKLLVEFQMNPRGPKFDVEVEIGEGITLFEANSLSPHTEFYRLVRVGIEAQGHKVHQITKIQTI